jgi:hypothetical protein
MGQDFSLPLCALCVVTGQVLSRNSEENVVINPLCKWANPMRSENVCSGVCHHPIYPPSRCQAKVVARVDCKLVLRLQADNQAWPLGWHDGNCPIGLCHVADGCLGSWGKAGDEQGHGGERAPGAREIIAVDVGVDREGLWLWAMRVREIVYRSVFAGLRSFGNKRQRGCLEWAQVSLQLAAREGANVMACGKLIIHDANVYVMKELKRRVIRRGVGVPYLGDPKAEAIGEALHEKGVFPV